MIKFKLSSVDDGEIEHKIQMKKLLVSGDQFGKSSNECMVAIFHYSSPMKWILGTIFM